MRSARSRVAGTAVLAVLASVLLSGCELREGDSKEYGAMSGGSWVGSGVNVTRELGQIGSN